MNREDVRSLYPVLPLRDIVLFPGMIVPLFVGRKKSINALSEAEKTGNRVLLVTQKTSFDGEAPNNQLYDVGVVAEIMQVLPLVDDTVKILVNGVKRVKIVDLKENNDYITSETEEIKDILDDEESTRELVKVTIEELENCIKINKKIPSEIFDAISQITDASKLADTIAMHMPIAIKQKQKILETQNVYERLNSICTHIGEEVESINTEKKIFNRIKRQMQKTHREYYLNEQMKAIKRELGDKKSSEVSDDDEIKEIENRLLETKLSEEAYEKVKLELKKLKLMSPVSAEAVIVRNYIDCVLSLPWNIFTEDRYDLEKCQEELDKNHFGISGVKTRILEYLAVQKRVKKNKGPIILLLGPPGVGKTSLARSIAKSIGKNFVSVSLGGVKDESEIRGHRKTYIGAMPGKIIQSIKKSKSSNPLCLLDEIDKIGRYSNISGDTSAALLEVLDPEHNNSFVDNFLEVEYDLSPILFIATANDLQSIPAPLLDRMEIIRISSYTDKEKMKIAKDHLIPKQIKFHNLKENEVSISDSVLSEIISSYTREAGVRNLDREIAKILRKSLKQIISDDSCNSVKVTKKNLPKFLGIQKYSHDSKNTVESVGVVSGLAYTEYGGELLTIEAISVPGKGEIKYTGKLGEVMQESIKAAFSYICNKHDVLNVDLEYYKKYDIHVHAPSGAVPKDGPSAGITIFVCLASLLSSVPVKNNVAMTGEITLSGKILKIGGLKEKLLAALREGITTVIIPKENSSDLEDPEMPQEIKEKLKIFQVQNALEAVEIALVSSIGIREDKEKFKKQESIKIEQVAHC